MEKRRPLKRITSHPLFHLLAAIVLVALVQAFFVKLFTVPSVSMESTLRSGDRILADRTAYWSSTPAHGDVIVFRADGSWQAESARGDSILRGALGALGYGPGNDTYLVKRVIAVANDEISCCDAEGRMVLNGEPLREAYVFQDLPFTARSFDCESPTTSPRCFPPVRVPADSLLVLGDHRSESADSLSACRGQGGTPSCARFVKRGDVVGRAFMTIWPMNQLGRIA